MRTFLGRLQLAAASLLFLLAFSFAPAAMARDTSSGNDFPENPLPVKVTDHSADTVNTKTEIENHANDLAEQFKNQARTRLLDDRAKVKERTQEERQKSCQARKQNLTKRMTDAVRHAKNHKAVFDKIYTRVKNYHDTKQLNVANYDTLVANTDKAQADAAASLSALESLNVSVDCTSQTVADTVAAFQQAVKNTRDSLKTYRSALVELITALKGASSSTNNQTGQ